jgi:hypothetical protein
MSGNGSRPNSIPMNTSRPTAEHRRLEEYRMIMRDREPIDGERTDCTESVIGKGVYVFRLRSGIHAIRFLKNDFTDFLVPRGTTEKMSKSVTITSTLRRLVRTQRLSTSILMRVSLTIDCTRRAVLAPVSSLNSSC